MGKGDEELFSRLRFEEWLVLAATEGPLSPGLASELLIW
jgi:hypothetical protein